MTIHFLILLHPSRTVNASSVEKRSGVRDKGFNAETAKTALVRYHRLQFEHELQSGGGSSFLLRRRTERPSSENAFGSVSTIAVDGRMRYRRSRRRLRRPHG